MKKGFAGSVLLGVSMAVAGVVACSSDGSSVEAKDGGQADGSLAATVHPLDTAILFPLPETAAQDGLLRAGSAGAKGALIPAYAWEALPALAAGKNADILPLLRLVSANVDPCFPSGVEGKVDDNGGSLCRSQLRLIFQPVHDDGAGTLTTDDVTVHTFYEMDRATFKSMVEAIVAARGSAPLGDGAIDVHPLIKSQGRGGAFAGAVQNLFLKYAGASNLVKVTFLGLRGAGVGWQMGGVDFVGTKATDMTVPETTGTREELTNPNAAAGDFDSVVDPPTKFSKGLGVLLKSTDARAASDDVVKAAFKQALQIDNPDTELNPGTVDCASCHLATPTALWVERNRGLKASDFSESYTNPRWNLTNRSRTKENTQSFRCFGYYGRQVSISQRTINEAAAVADFINAKILGGAK